jgi:hypothetical protein
MEEHVLPYEVDGNKEHYTIDWDRVVVIKHFSKSRQASLDFTTDSNELQFAFASKIWFTHELKTNVYHSPYTLSQFEQIKIYFGKANKLIAKYLQGKLSESERPAKLEELGFRPSADSKELSVFVSDRWFGKAKKEIERMLGSKSKCQLEDFAVIIEGADNDFITSSTVDNANLTEEMKQFKKLMRDSIRDEQGDDKSSDQAYQIVLERIKAAGVTPGLGIGHNLEGEKLAMKYLLRGEGDHVPDAADKIQYPILGDRAVRLIAIPGC